MMKKTKKSPTAWSKKARCKAAMVGGDFVSKHMFKYIPQELTFSSSYATLKSQDRNLPETYPNIWCTHPQAQDAIFGACLNLHWNYANVLNVLTLFFSINIIYSHNSSTGSYRKHRHISSLQWHWAWRHRGERAKRPHHGQVCWILLSVCRKSSYRTIGSPTAQSLELQMSWPS